MVRVLILLFILPLLSCNEASTKSRTSTYASNKYGTVSPYIRSFDSYYYRFKGGTLPINNLKITMVKSLSNSQAIGTCHSISKEIKILESYWTRASDSQKKLLVYHELAHCYLNRPHKSQLVNGIPVSIMYPSNIHREHFKAFESMPSVWGCWGPAVSSHSKAFESLPSGLGSSCRPLGSLFPTILKPLSFCLVS